MAAISDFITEKSWEEEKQPSESALGWKQAAPTSHIQKDGN